MGGEIPPLLRSALPQSRKRGARGRLNQEVLIPKTRCARGRAKQGEAEQSGGEGPPTVAKWEEGQKNGAAGRSTEQCLYREFYRLILRFRQPFDAPAVCRWTKDSRLGPYRKAADTGLLARCGVQPRPSSRGTSL